MARNLIRAFAGFLVVPLVFFGMMWRISVVGWNEAVGSFAIGCILGGIFTAALLYCEHGRD